MRLLRLEKVKWSDFFLQKRHFIYKLSVKKQETGQKTGKNPPKKTLLSALALEFRKWGAPFAEGEQEYPLDIWSSDKGSGHRIVILSPHWWNVIWSLIGRELWEPLPNQIFWTLNVHEKTEQCCTLLWTSWCRSRCRCTSTGTTPAFNSRILSRFSSCLKLNIWLGHKGRGSS